MAQKCKYESVWIFDEIEGNPLKVSVPHTIVDLSANTVREKNRTYYIAESADYEREINVDVSPQPAYSAC